MSTAKTFFLVALVTLAGAMLSQAVDYTVTNNAGNSVGGLIFTNQIGDPYSKGTLAAATDYVWKTFRQNTPQSRKDVPSVSLSIDNNLDVPAETSNNEIQVSATYLKDYKGDVKTEFTGILYHETTHVWQWNGNGQAPGGLIEGIADYVRLKAGYAPSHWVKPGRGDRWDQGYDVTAHFLNYCNSLRDGFVADLNEKLRNGYSVDYFGLLLGKNVDQLWKDYKAQYAS